MSRTIFTMTALLALVGGAVVLAPRPTHSAQERMIRVTARKFEYTPSEITVK